MRLLKVDKKVTSSNAKQGPIKNIIDYLNFRFKDLNFLEFDVFFILLFSRTQNKKLII